MVSFEGVRHGTAGWGRPWKFTRQFSLYIAGVVIAAVVALAAGASSLSGEPSRQATLAGSPYPSNPADIMPGVDQLLALAQLPNTFSSSLPTAFTDNFEIPAPPPEPVAPAPEQAAPAAVPVNAAPASVPVEQPKPAPPPPAPAEKPNFYVPEVSTGGITNLEQRLFDGINAERANAGLSPYTYDAGLSKIARIRVQQMADQGYFAHVDPYGYSMYTELLARFGYRYAWAGENLALNNFSVAESPERALTALMNSPTHAANILAGDFFRIGIGEVATADGRHLYAMIFLG